MTALEKLQKMREQMRQGLFKNTEGNTKKEWLWQCFNNLVAQYQKENNISFMLLPCCDEYSIKKWIEDLSDMEQRKAKK